MPVRPEPDELGPKKPRLHEPEPDQSEQVEPAMPDRSAAPRVPRCPLCGQPRVERYRPFCSARCRDKDLLAWLDGRYAVPAVETDEPDDDLAAGDDPEPRR